MNRIYQNLLVWQSIMMKCLRCVIASNYRDKFLCFLFNYEIGRASEFIKYVYMWQTKHCNTTYTIHSSPAFSFYSIYFIANQLHFDEFHDHNEFACTCIIFNKMHFWQGKLYLEYLFGYMLLIKLIISIQIFVTRNL